MNADPEPTQDELLQRLGIAIGRLQGRLIAARSILKIWGRRKFGLDPTAEPRLKAITDIDRLEWIAERIFDATSWDDLLSTP